MSPFSDRCLVDKFLSEDAVDQVVIKRAVDIMVLAQAGLEFETVSFEQGNGGHIKGAGLCMNAVQFEIEEEILEQQSQGVGGIALAAIVRSDQIADFGRMVARVDIEVTDSAHKCVIFDASDGNALGRIGQREARESARGFPPASLDQPASKSFVREGSSKTSHRIG